MPPATSNAVLLEKLETISTGLNRMECKVDAIETRLQSVEKKDIEYQITNSQQLLAAFRRVDEHDAKIKNIESNRLTTLEGLVPDVKKIPNLETRIKNVEDMMPALRIFTWIAGALGLSIIGLIWSLITGAAHVYFR
jgi:hypothetical protein